ncbi:MAG TPA: single-stranded-DNA-specific exonuclease RecJ [Dissulfurispiraceae bacterium]|nr:single-stranded-DNA-specific exonuclease RecJ [Dissulfurispiraceae bacterium]
MADSGMVCRWIINRTNPDYVAYIARIASVSPLLAQVLVNRGLKTAAQLDAFLNPDISKLADPFALPQVKAAIKRIREAKKNVELVLVHGDYDADGVTATAIMVEGLREYGLEVRFFIPDRIQHGYGFGAAGLERAEALGAKLIVTVDCGISSFEAASAARRRGIDLIITDHHEPVRNESKRNGESEQEFILPEAVAVVNPKAAACPHEMAHLSGAGVALKLIQGLFDNNIDAIYKFFDLAAIGTAADVVPVRNDNRTIIREGMKLLQSGQRIGLKALCQTAGIRPDSFKTSSLHYTLIPRINAAGRIANATDVVTLLTTRSVDEAWQLAGWMNNLNARRQEAEESVYNEALEKVRSMDAGEGALVIASEGWHIGVVGIVASKIAQKYYRPAIVLSIDGGIAKGSGRSIPPFDLYEGLTECKDVLTRFGGHKQAAGLSLPSADIEQFRTLFCRKVRERVSEEDFLPVLLIDGAVSISDMSIGLVKELARMEPFGYSNVEPVFGARGLEVLQPRIVGNNHLKMQLRQNGRKMDSIGFDFGSLLGSVEESGLIDAAFMPTVNEWDGGRYLQLNLKAIRPAEKNRKIRNSAINLSRGE